MNILLNGKATDIASGTNVYQLVYSLKLNPETVLAEINEHIVKKLKWPGTILQEGDKVELVKFVGGG